MTFPAPSPAHPLCSRLTLDLRSLALLRAGLGFVLLIDSLCRLFAAGALYTDAGLLPRDLAVGVIEAGRWSLHLANGGLLFALVLAGLQVLASAALAVGWRSRISGVLLWLLLVSAMARHPAMFDASDALSLGLLTFGLLLPWNARFSVDAAFAGARPGPVYLSWPGIALLVFVCLLPIGLSLAADAPGGLRTVLSAPIAHAPGSWLLRADTALPALGMALHIAAWLILPLALAPWARPHARRAALCLSVLLCAFALLGVSPAAVAIVCLLASALLIDSALWDRLGGDPNVPELRIHPHREQPGAIGLSLLLREFLCLQRAQVAAAQDSPRAARLLANGAAVIVIDRNEEAYLDATAVATLLRRSPLLWPLRKLLRGGLPNTLGGVLLRLRGVAGLGRRVGSDPTAAGAAPAWGAIAAGALLLTTSLVQLGAAGAMWSPITGAARVVLRPLGLDRSWIELLPSAQTTERWIAVPGERADGGEVDALIAELSAPDYAAPNRSWFGGERGRRYERVLAQPDSQVLRLAFARHLCEQHADDLARVRITQMVREAGARLAEQRVLLRHECRAAAAEDDAP